MYVYYTSYIPRLPTRSTRLCDIIGTWVLSNANSAASLLHRMPVQFESPLEGNQRTSLHIRHQTTSLAATLYMACFHCIAKTTSPQLYLPQLGDTDCPRPQKKHSFTEDAPIHQWQRQVSETSCKIETVPTPIQHMKNMSCLARHWSFGQAPLC